MTDLHPDLTPVARLVGTWTGRGHGHYPTIDDFDYLETVTFGHVGKPFLSYVQRTQALRPDGTPGPPMHAESGYWRFPSPGRVEVVVSHPTGINEIEEGTIGVRDDAIVFELVATQVVCSPTAKSVTAVERTFRLVDDSLTYAVRMAAVGLPLQDHLSAQLHRSASD